mgnify:CR=1 FL=1
MILSKIFGRSKADDAAYRLYQSLVGQARAPQFYLDFGVPDSLSGRFEMIVLHAFLILDRLKGEGKEAAGLAQRIFDIMFDDMDQSLRELGVGDLSVGKKIQTMASVFYGRTGAFDEGVRALEQPGGTRAALEAAVARNLFPDGAPDKNLSGGEAVTVLTDYLLASRALLAGQPVAGFLAGEARFAPPPGRG